MGINIHIICNQLRRLIKQGEDSMQEPIGDFSYEYYRFYYEMKEYLDANCRDAKPREYIAELPNLKLKDFKGFEFSFIYIIEVLVAIIFPPYLIYWIIQNFLNRKRNNATIKKINVLLNQIIVELETESSV
ncbi:MAG: hypothetical protein H6586_02245 [Flavobacteriales bacterium]|nr:hypothetical protein [Flavobacteriales bacterium]